PTNPFLRCQRRLRASCLPRAFDAFDPGHGSRSGALAQVFAESATLSPGHPTSNEPITTDSIEPTMAATVAFPAGRPQQCSEQLPMSNVDTLSDQGSGMRISQQSSMILSRLPPQMTTQLFASAFKHAVKAGEALFVAGDRGDGCYRVEQGLVKITVMSDRGEERIIALVGAGEIMGELSLIDHQPRSASAIALCDSTFRYITRQAFEDCTKDDPEIYQGSHGHPGGTPARDRRDPGCRELPVGAGLCCPHAARTRGLYRQGRGSRTHSARPADQRKGPGCHGRGGARE